MEKYQKYAEYKDSGVEWLGMIPSSWQVKKLKYLCQVTTGNKDTVNAVEDGKYPFFVRSQTVERINSIGADCEAVLTAGDGVGVGKVYHYYKGKFDFHQRVYMLYDFGAVTGRFVYYYLSSNFYKVALEGNAKSTVDSLRLPQFLNFEFSLPTIEEQNQIANFLDHETAQIDILIAKQEKLIELLKEKRQAVISHAVTKGLNPNVAMKDSGVEWLGQVPEHWTVTRAKFVSDIFVPQRNKPELNDMEGYSWVTMDDMKNKYIQSVNRYVTKNSAMLAGSKILKKGAVIASCVGNFGITSINNIDVIINQQLQAFIPRNIKAEYLQNLVSISKKYFELIGTAATLVYVNQEGFQNLPVLLPPYDEQVAICVQIENDENKYDQLIHLGLKQIKILQERRTALISSAVTGKIDVRNWQYPNEAKTELSA